MSETSARTRLPDFLIIGAMKAGTTTLYEDLRQHPALFMPEAKEPDILIGPGHEIRPAYERLFAKAGPEQLCGEASTSCTKSPVHEGVAFRARDLCGPGLKLIHLTRDPVARIVSHYKHLYGMGLETRPFAQAVREDVSYIAFSDYTMQLEPWREAFGDAALLELSFERYITDRSGTLKAICAHLDIPHAPLAQIDTDAAYNVSDDKLVAEGLWRRFLTSRFYGLWLKPLFPTDLRRKVARVLLPRTQPLEVVVDDATRALILERLGRGVPS